MNRVAHKTEEINRTQNVRFHPFVFNGKEKDYESGFHYYGARYYWSEVLTGWLSVDPMADKYPSISPYNYCMWNPMKIVMSMVWKPIFPHYWLNFQEGSGINIEQTAKAISYIQGQLEQGIPVMIGVDEGVTQNINEGTTDHFLVIVGQGNDENGNYFIVYDNARHETEEGTSEMNRIYLKEDGRLYGEMPRPSNRYVPYTISQVRPTTKKKKNRY